MTRDPVPEARLQSTDGGMRPQGDGWFVVNVADAVAVGADDSRYSIRFEGQHRAFPHFGINVTVLGPGQPAALYHAEAGQEAFLVLSGECVLIVEDQERRLRRWDFFHCPPGTAHVIVGAGEEPCAVLMVGARKVDGGVVYPVSATADAHGAAVAEETSDPATAYAGWRRPAPGRFPWPPASGTAGA